FQSHLDDVENELTSPDHEYEGDPAHAQIGDVLPGGFEVLRRLGQGASSVALLVQRDNDELILKVANDPEHNDRLTDEIRVLRKIRHAHIVEFVEELNINERVAFLMKPVFVDREKRGIETLGQRLRKEGRLQVELLQRFGEDLLGVVGYLEEQGISHRDLKPDNIAVGQVGAGSKLHLVLFDFSLSRARVDNIRAGTTGYLDPLLPLRKPPRWDLHAERYAAAATLYELATGSLPQWGDGASDPSHLSATTEITLDGEQFDPGLRESLLAFFRQAFRRSLAERFDNAEDMLRAWRRAFDGVDSDKPSSDHIDEGELRELLASAAYETQIAELGLGTRAANALDRANILTVEDLLTASVRRLQRLRGVGNKTRREIAAAVRILRERLGAPPADRDASSDDSAPEIASADLASLGIDLLAERLQRVARKGGDSARLAVECLLGLDPQLTRVWPSQAEVAERVGVTRARIGQFVGTFQTRWSKDSALTTLRDNIRDAVAAHGRIMTLAELTDALLIARGSPLEEPQRSAVARAVVRAAVEVERTMSEPRFVVRRDGDRVFVAQSVEQTIYAGRLGDAADALAAEDPLAAPQRVVERLRELPAPAKFEVPDVRLVRLAAGASRTAAVSSRQELYPRNMSALRALKLSQGAVHATPKDGRSYLTPAKIQERVASRYPQAEPLPRP
ncbi:MAG TPA: DNA-directed RNA polymerase subunit alpha C-terminal domain-containing protein, partial [Pirellulales bacterium]